MEKKDLGVTISNNPKLARQCQLAYAKASKASHLKNHLFKKCQCPTEAVQISRSASL